MIDCFSHIRPAADESETSALLGRPAKKRTKAQKIQSKLDSLPTFRPYFMWFVLLAQVCTDVSRRVFCNVAQLGILAAFFIDLRGIAPIGITPKYINEDVRVGVGSMRS
jgi:hypothetical protein